MPRRIVLYHTAGCHLCEKAKDLLWPFISQGLITLIECDIADSDQLIEKYGVQIPVLCSENGDEIKWPFDVSALEHWLVDIVD
ncbi:MAG: glutaredoxin family protein [Cellvibrio sp.]|nr:glutaredoxin family protein [Cellvibrio sp.]